MNKKVVFLIFLLSVGMANKILASCTMNFSPVIYFVNLKAIPFTKGLIHNTTCAEKINSAGLTILSNYTGSIKASTLSRVLREETGEEVIVSPETIEIDDLKNIMSRFLIKNSDYKISSLKLLDGKEVLLLDSPESFSLLEPQSLHPGSLQVQFKLRQSSSWAILELIKKTKVLVSSKDLPVNADIANHVQWKELYHSSYEDFSIQEDLIPHMKTIRSIEKDRPIKRSDLTLNQLVAPGRAVDMEIVNETIRISAKGHPLSGGSYGQNIQLKSLNSNKILTGKVVGLDKVVVHL